MDPLGTDARQLERERFMADASSVLNGTLDFSETLRRLTRIAVPTLADWCAVYIADANERLHIFEVAHVNEHKRNLALELEQKFPADPEHSGVYRVYRTGTSEYFPHISYDMVRSSVNEPERQRIIGELGFRSVMTVPLTARGVKLGVMAFISAESQRRYYESDLAFAEDLAARAATAALNARLFQEAERRAREEAALRRATEAVAATFSVDEVIEQIARSALEATDADGSFVERLQPDGKSVVVVATAGSMCPALGDATTFEGSIAQLVLETRQPARIDVIGQAAHPLPGTLSTTYATSSAVAVPLIDAGEAIGALILLRARENGAFTTDEAVRAHTFGNLASLAFRKVHLLQASEERNREIERMMESRLRLMRGFSHDLKNPLGAADGHAALLEDGMLGELTEQQKRSVSRIRAGITAAVQLIDDLVELARAEAGQLVIKQQPVDVREIVRELVEAYRPAAEQAGLEIRGVLEAVDVISSDSDRVRQVLGNLISNAVKYTERGGEIEVRSAVSDGAVTVVVKDTGLGIPEDKLHLLFTEFARIDPGVKPGAGLGLAISRRIARLLGGDILVESNRGKGSTFTLWLPNDGNAMKNQD